MATLGFINGGNLVGIGSVGIGTTNPATALDVFTGTMNAATVVATTHYGAIAGSNTVSASTFTGAGSGITSLNMGNAGSGTLAVARGGTGVTSSTGTGSVVLSAGPTLSGTVTGGTFSGTHTGDGSGITLLNMGNAGSGTLAVARGGTGVTSSTGTGSVVLSAGPTLSGTVTGGTFSGTHTGDGSGITLLNMGNAGSGTLAVTRGGTGVTSSTGTGSVVLSASPALSGTATFAAITTSGAIGIGASPSYTLDVAGVIRATGDIIAFSDRRVKSNLEKITGALDKVAAINGYTFTRSDGDSDERHAGVVAQEVQEVLPEVVSVDKEGHLSVAYGNMVALLIEALKEEKSKREALEGELEVARRDHRSLEGCVTQMQVLLSKVLETAGSPL